MDEYASNYDNVYNIKWDYSKEHFEIEMNGSSDWPSKNYCDDDVLKKLAKPWPVYIWLSD